MPATTYAQEEEHLLRIPLAQLLPHPLNANRMNRRKLDKLARNIEREGRYPPLVVRSHPEYPDSFQILDGHHRLQVLQKLGYPDALCLRWECDEETALRLLATLNRLEGEDVPAKRSALLSELGALLPPQELARLLPESHARIQAILADSVVDGSAILSQFTEATERQGKGATRVASFSLSVPDAADVEAAIDRLAGQLRGANARGRALAIICRDYLDRDAADQPKAFT